MRIEFDSAKDAINRDKHGVSLGFGELVLLAAGRIIVDAIRPVDGEDRRKAIGLVEGRLWTAVYVERAGNVRFISVRKSNDAESRGYHRHPRRSQ